MKRQQIAPVLALLLAALAVLISAPVTSAQESGASGDSGEANPRATIETSKGKIVVELYADKAPGSVKNFIAYAEDGFYEGTIFHRVMKGFMVQGGGLTPDMQRKQTRAGIQNEADNGLKNHRGTLAMARTNDPHSATSQFYINTVNNVALDHTSKDVRGWGYAVFGQVLEGMDVVDAIESVQTTRRGPHTDVPAEPIFIQKVTIQK